MVSKDNKRVMITLPKKVCQKVDKKLDDSGMTFTQYVTFLIFNDLRKEER